MIGDKRDYMDGVLLDIVLRRLAESPPAEQPTNLLLAALQDEESLSAQLGGQAAQQLRERAEQLAAAALILLGAHLIAERLLTR